MRRVTPALLTKRMNDRIASGETLLYYLREGSLRGGLPLPEKPPDDAGRHVCASLCTTLMMVGGMYAPHGTTYQPREACMRSWYTLPHTQGRLVGRLVHPDTGSPRRPTRFTVGQLAGPKGGKEALRTVTFLTIIDDY